jgi:Fe-S-cluster containining protein
MNPGEVYPFEPTGRCRLLVDDRCLIHEAKPAECAVYDHNRTGEECHATKRSIVDKWRSQQDQVRQLLGDDPVEPEGSNLDLLFRR